MTKKLNESNRKRILLRLMILFLCAVGLLFVSTCREKTPVPAKEIQKSSEEAPAEPVRIVFRSALAEKGWYPADANTLNKQIEGFFRRKASCGKRADAEPIKNVIALILPHAGYRYSGQIAVCGIKTIDKEYKRIVVIGPSHTPYLSMEEILSLPRVTHYQTPLGQIPLDVEFIEKLLKYPMFQNLPRAHRDEHSVQIELPLLQYSRKDFKLVPIVAGVCSPETITKAAAILRGLVDEETLVIASSDFVHYGYRFHYVPFTENIPEQIKRLDMGAYEHIAELDSRGFLKYKQKTGATICGYIPIAILLSMLDKPVEAHLIKYATSGELTGDFTNSVSYLSAAFSGLWRSQPEVKPRRSNSGLTEQDKKQLLTLARKTILYVLKNRQVPQASELGVTVSDAMKVPRAAFVTLKKNSQLRGCIGDIFPRQPLYKSVIINAINATLNDRRFLPVTEAECSDINIEISALTAPEPVASPDDIRIGIDGIVLNKDGRSAVFLPQVAPEQGWDVNQTLTRLSLKAKLPADAWKQGANFLVFQADVFGEEK